MDKKTPKLEVRRLQSQYFGPVELTISAGECLAIRGASGSGKSLLLRAIADLDVNDGDVTLDGINKRNMPAPLWRKLVGLVPAESGWWADRVGDHFSDHAGLLDLLDDVGMEADTLNWDVVRLSTGERHRLSIVRSLVLQPHVLLLDEPTAALDREATSLIENIIERELAKGTAILLVTHDPEQAQRIAHRDAIIEDGKILVSELTKA